MKEKSKTNAEIEKEFDEKFGNGYDRNRVVLMTADPETIFAYWGICKKDREKLKESELVLRLFNLKDKSVSLINIGRNNFMGNYYVRGSEVRPNGRYIAEINAINSNFYPFLPLISNIIETPRNTASGDLTVEFLDPVKEMLEKEKLRQEEGKKALRLIKKAEEQIKKDRESSDFFHNYFIK